MSSNYYYMTWEERAKKSKDNSDAFLKRRDEYNEITEKMAKFLGISVDDYITQKDIEYGGSCRKSKEAELFYKYQKAPRPWATWAAKHYYEKLEIKPDISRLKPTGVDGRIKISDIRNSNEYESLWLEDMAKTIGIVPEQVAVKSGKRGTISALDIVVHLYKQKKA